MPHLVKSHFFYFSLFDAGRELWRYYHSQKNANAAYYDIREYFQGRRVLYPNTQGRINSKSEDKKYCELIANLREKMKVYEYGFLIR